MNCIIKKYILEEEQKLFKDTNNKSNKEIDIKSNWCGKININNGSSPTKEWVCSITIDSSTLEQEKHHELLHTNQLVIMMLMNKINIHLRKRQQLNF